MTQAEALAILKTGVNVFLTGEPGSGKTHTVNAYVQYLRERGVEPAITASTGIAATHVGGYTIHSWSGIGVKRDVDDYDIEMILNKEKTAKRIISAKVLIIDEISMLDASTLSSVDRVLRTIRRRPLMEEEPFGGLQVIFVGDFFQLPPVSKNSSATFAFNSGAWKDANPVVCYLAEQHRQEDESFVRLLSSWRKGVFDDDEWRLFEERIGTAPAEGAVTRLYTHNADVDRINNEKLDELDGPSRVFWMQTQGSKTLVESLRASCLSPEQLSLKQGAAVIFTRNNFDAGYVNGTLGTVSGFDESGYPVVTTNDGRTIIVETAEWSLQDGNKVLARITQLPLRLAWAITIHKSQGMSLDAAVIDLRAAFEYGQGYVAVSRVRSLRGLYIEGIGERALMLHPEVVEKDREFRRRSELAQQKFSALAPASKATMEANFLRAIGAREPNAVALEQPQLSRLEKTRQTFPNAGRPWTEADDQELKDMFATNVPQKEIAEHFGRKPSAIHARLGHLGLVEDNYWANKART